MKKLLELIRADKEAKAVVLFAAVALVILGGVAF